MHAVATGTHWVINLSLGDEQSRNDTAHQLYVDVFTEFCAADGIAVLAAGNGERFKVCVSCPGDSEDLILCGGAGCTNETAAAAVSAEIVEQIRSWHPCQPVECIASGTCLTVACCQSPTTTITHKLRRKAKTARLKKSPILLHCVLC
jgi:hypothetical protein